MRVSEDARPFVTGDAHTPHGSGTSGRVKAMQTQQAFDFEPAYRAHGYGAIAWRVTGYAQEWTAESWQYDEEGDPDDEASYFYNEPEQVEDRSRVVAHMIGDDRDFTFDVDDLEPIEREDYCGVCGQIGCAHDGYDRD